ncbi:MAG TPA: POTRA domain-containing protein [Paludibacteraceae bacterium]|nr:BamA/TamA family outer membrane protein [Paludibacteraceae bacterium]OPZ01876.1 MAG: Outer membrane protein assembly factor BamA precursor [Bacteroidetes bacterium ADurb.BinA395]MBP8967324.1 BamA/TamA family outer membrane protein [Paludibacteraceae bacterium]HOF99038.1 POTRA domain-containing protein [Paludibacteraceae bacterium]HON02700.1 POTRA domain-containing protein [Paludibacteraceae bacterium]
MKNKIYFILFLIFFHQLSSFSQNSKNDSTSIATENESVPLPVIEYSNTNPKYEIAEITVTGADHYEDFVLIGFSGLSVGQVISVPGPEITEAVKRFWKQGLFSDVKIYATKIENGKVWLNISLKERPRISKINYSGLKKGEIEDLEKKLNLSVGNQITPNITDRIITVIKKYMEEKGFLNTDVFVYQKDDPEKPGHVIVDIEVNKKIKTSVHKIYVTGNQALTVAQIDKAMKKTNEKNLRNFFRSKKFVKQEYENDKKLIIEKYNEIGYRDAYIVTDSIVPFNEKSVDIYLTINEGKKYYFRNISWIGNTVYPYEFLNEKLGIKKGDLYNYNYLIKRLLTDENDAISKLYQNNGYLFFQIEPVEVHVENDSIDFEIRIYEGKQATINEIGIKGNTRVYEHVIRRELRTKPGQLYSQEDIVRSLRELAQMGHFDQEKMNNAIDIQPDPENGTVDINYVLESKGNDQIEFSAGWGATGVVGSVGLKFSNFAIQNLFNPDTYRIVPQGEGQTFSLNARTNGQSYSSFSISFLEPWLGGKRPNSLSASVYYSTQTAISNRYLNYINNLSSMYYGGYYGGYYNDYYGNNYNYYQTEVDPDRYMRTLGASLGYGKRLNWPDDYFSFYSELSFQRFMLNNWYAGYFPMTSGTFNNLSMNLILNRSSIDNPIYTRTGSLFSLGLKFTPPYSVFNGKDYSQEMSNEERYKFIEYHKWTFTGKTFTPLTPNNKLVLMARAQFSYLGYYNKNARSPFETFYMGGDGMSSYTSYGTEYVAMRGYENGSLTPYDTKTGIAAGYLYNKYTMELRYPLSLEQSATIYVLSFVEAGNCFNSISGPNGYNPFNLKRSAGIGVRIFLPMFGMMGIDWGYGFDTVTGATKPSGSQFHFVLGQEL